VTSSSISPGCVDPVRCETACKPSHALHEPWLVRPATPRRLYRDALEEPTFNLLFGHNTAVIATSYEDGSPSATPVGRVRPFGSPLLSRCWLEVACGVGLPHRTWRG